MLFAGACMPIQSSLNLYIARWASSNEFASMISFFVGTICLIAFVIFFTKFSFSNLNFSTPPPTYAWIAGVLGAFIVTSVILVAPKIGMTSMFLSIISGQMLMSVIIDKYGLLGMQIKEISFTKVIAIILVFIGAWLFTFDK